MCRLKEVIVGEGESILLNYLVFFFFSKRKFCKCIYYFEILSDVVMIVLVEV